jgi:hypothetical protein
MLIKIDRAAVELFRYRTEGETNGRHRRYYCANAPIRAIIVCDNNLDLRMLIGRVIDANVGNDNGWREFVREGNIGQRHTKITLRRVSDSPRADRYLSQVVQDAPRDPK